MGAFSHQSSKTLPAVEGGSGAISNQRVLRARHRRQRFELAAQFPDASPYKKYNGTGIGPKFRIHSLGAALARHQLRKLTSTTR
jgi:dTDP-4-amino-4,6-dideoxygalactose transaminase